MVFISLAVPIIPAFLYELHHEKDMVVLNETIRTSTQSPSRLYNSRLEAQREAAEILPFLTKSDDNGECKEEVSDNQQTTTTDTPENRLRHEELINENAEVGIMFASKPIVQAMTNPFIGPLTNR